MTVFKEGKMKYEIIIYDNTYNEEKCIKLTVKDDRDMGAFVSLMSAYGKPIKVIGEKDD